jgi:hypothetical protein
MAPTASARIFPCMFRVIEEPAVLFEMAGFLFSGLFNMVSVEWVLGLA